MTTRRTTILLDGDLLDRLDRLARQRRATKTALVAEAVEAYLASHEGDPEVLPFVGIADSGHGRLSLDGKRIASRELGRRGA